MNSENLQKAIDSLSIQDVYLRDQVASCIGDFEAKYSPDIENLTVQHMHIVKQSRVFEIEEDGQLLSILVRLGVRWIDPDIEGEDLAIRAMIEAEFVADYQMTIELDKECIDEFALKNASYHVWPYWRELLSSQCARMHLPRLILPTVQFAQNRLQEGEAADSSEDQA